jgi:hypothetical protein
MYIYIYTIPIHIQSHKYVVMCFSLRLGPLSCGNGAPCVGAYAWLFLLWRWPGRVEASAEASQRSACAQRHGGVISTGCLRLRRVIVLSGVYNYNDYVYY